MIFGKGPQDSNPITHPVNGQNDQMHPEDRRNLILFIAIVSVLWVGYDQLIVKPRMAAAQAQLAAQQAAAAAASPADSSDAMVSDKTRDQVVAPTLSQRGQIDNGVVKGTLPLTGNRLDDIQLTKYVTAVGSQDHVAILTPPGTAHPRYAEFGWVPDGDVAVPSKDTHWTVKGDKDVGPNHPVTMTWDNGQGLTFTRTVTVDDKYVIGVKQSVTNHGAKPVTLYPYALVAQIGLPENYVARSAAHEGPIAYVGNTEYEPTYKQMDEGKAKMGDKDVALANGGWIGITEKYFLAGILPQQGEPTKFRFITKEGSRPGDPKRYQTDILGDARTIAPNATAESDLGFFTGAKEVRVLDAYEKSLKIPHFDLAVDFGLYYFLTKPFFFVLSFLGHAIGNFGVAIIVFTFMLRLLMFPLNNTSYRSFAKMKKIGPEMSALREKYKGNDPETKKKLQTEMIALYSREKVNPAAGCLPILLQIPVFFALYKVLSVTIEMRQAPFFGWIHDLSVKDPTTIVNLFGLLPFHNIPQTMMIGAWPCLMLLAMLAQRSMNPPPQDPAQAKMVMFMPYMMTFIMAKFAAGLVIYWTVSNTLSVIQQYVIMRSMGVEVKFFHRPPIEKKLERQVAQGPDIHPGAVMLEEQLEDAVAGEIGKISPPKPRRKKKK